MLRVLLFELSFSIAGGLAAVGVLVGRVVQQPPSWDVTSLSVFTILVSVMLWWIIHSIKEKKDLVRGHRKDIDSLTARHTNELLLKDQEIKRLNELLRDEIKSLSSRKGGS